MNRSYSQDAFERLMNAKMLINVLNVIVFLIALATFGLCMWIRFDLDFQYWVREMDWYSYWYCMYVILFGVCFVLVNCVLSFYGSYSDSLGALTTTHVIYVIAMIFELVGAIVICVYGVEESEILTEQLKNRFLDMIYAYEYDDRSTRILKQIQEYVGCCGAHGSEDYNRAYKPVPMECRDQVTGREYRYGCAQQLAWWLEPWTAALAGISIGLIFFHVAQMIVTSKLKKRIREYGQMMQGDYY